MAIEFRPLPRLTIVTVIAFAILITLGVWQLERLQWKRALIAEANANVSAPALSLDQALALGAEMVQYHRVAVTGRFDNAKEAYIFTTGDQGAPVYHVVTPLILADGRALMIDRGTIPLTLRDPKSRTAGLPQGEHRVIGVWRTPDAAGMFTPQPDTTKHVWYSRDVRTIAKADSVVLAAPVIVEADATPNPGGWPRGGQTVIQFRNEHLQYAITWFALAAALLGVYLAYHRSHGRLKFR
ncbi:MAG: SURF1 family protein [Proteobacteria bacterium]|nr:SURF1 family protein [Pseudomonadota bacterium]